MLLFTDEKSWEAEGLKLDMIEPMKKWTVHYEGSMVHQANKTTHHVQLSVMILLVLSTRMKNMYVHATCRNCPLQQ